MICRILAKLADTYIGSLYYNQNLYPHRVIWFSNGLEWASLYQVQNRDHGVIVQL